MVSPLRGRESGWRAVVIFGEIFVCSTSKTQNKIGIYKFCLDFISILSILTSYSSFFQNQVFIQDAKLVYQLHIYEHASYAFEIKVIKTMFIL